jgi:hypothetical protein
MGMYKVPLDREAQEAQKRFQMKFKFYLFLYYTFAQITKSIPTRKVTTTTARFLKTFVPNSIQETIPMETIEEKPTTGMAIGLITLGFLMLMVAMGLLVYRFKTNRNKVQILNRLKPLPDIPL